ncbi:MAG: hypothetical protein FWG32_06075, partial [Oscillospiraceae bacterium]|nr:hypothetical protein [Oscillospiraceae bacterium]
MTIPKYANDTIYKKLADLCEAAGRPVRYVQTDDDIYAKTREHDALFMPDDERFRSSEHATMVLGHELGHHLVSSFYVDTEFNNPYNNEAMNTAIEAQCDVAGV